MPDTLTVLTSLATSGALTAGLLWLTKSWISERLRNSIKHEYDQKLVAYEAKINAERDTKLERFRADLQAVAYERQIRYQALHEKVAETVAQAYALLQTLYGAVETHLSDVRWSSDPPDEKLREIIRRSISEFHDYYRPRRIYLPKEVAEQVDAFEKKLSSITRKHMRFQENEQKMSDDEWVKRAGEIAGMINKELPAVFEKLENEFRRLLGSKIDT